MESNADRLVCVHMNDAVAGRPLEEQKDMERRLPMDTGVINSKEIMRRFQSRGSDALFMIEPFEPERTRFSKMSAEEAVNTATAVMKRLC